MGDTARTENAKRRRQREAEEAIMVAAGRVADDEGLPARPSVKALRKAIDALAELPKK